MKLASVKGRAALIVAAGIADLETVSHKRFGPELAPIFEQWPEFVEFANSFAGEPTGPLVEADLRCPVDPGQVFAVGLNYRAHSQEAGMELPEFPGTFTKFRGSLAGPYDDVTLVGDHNDWEVELVAVVGRRAENVDRTNGWDHIAGLAVGQDISDRKLQFAAGNQWSLGKSRPGYGPVGPWVTSVDAVANRDDLAISCSVDGETVQQSRTSQLIFSVPDIVAELSAITPLQPGDIIFTGTPSGVGFVREPPRYLRPGQTLESRIEGLGVIRNRFR
jgi:2,4-didehydro-3-deoxy-L-rhamnonate hydrolase